jgi:flagellar biosynthesis GTPase FlhF
VLYLLKIACRLVQGVEFVLDDSFPRRVMAGVCIDTRQNHASTTAHNSSMLALRLVSLSTARYKVSLRPLESRITASLSFIFINTPTTMNIHTRNNPQMSLHRRSSSAPEVIFEARAQEDKYPLAQIDEYLLNRLRRQLEKSKASYGDVLRDYEQALLLYNETRVENMRLRHKVAMLERVLVGRTGAESHPVPDYFGMH